MDDKNFDTDLANLKATLQSGSTHFISGNEGLLNHFSNLVFKQLLDDIIEDEGNWDSDTLEFLTEVKENTALINLDAIDCLAYLDAIGLDYTDLAEILGCTLDDLAETHPNPGS